MEAWMKQESVNINDVAPRQLCGQWYDSLGKEALQIAMAKYLLVVIRHKGHGVKNVKTHSVLHLPDDILFFGSPNI
jgi:hypothetical protein